jgi:hypothetical protein
MQHIITWVPCDYCVVCRGPMSGGDTVCSWTVDVNILNSQSWADSKGWFSRSGVELECLELTAVQRMLQIATRTLRVGVR